MPDNSSDFLKRIVPPAAPPDVADDRVRQEIDDIEKAKRLAGLNPTARHHHDTERIIKILQADREKLQSENERLRNVELEHSRYGVSDRYSTLVLVVCAPIVLLGTCFISQYASATDGVGVQYLGIGWGMVWVGLLFQFLIGLFNPNR